MDVFASFLTTATQPDLPWPLLAAMAAGTTLMIMLTRRRIAKLSDAPNRRRTNRTKPSPHSPGARKGVQEELREVMADLERLAREVNAQIDTKYLKLEAVIRDADERVARLEALADAAHRPIPDFHVQADGGWSTQPVTGHSPEVCVNPAMVHALADRGSSSSEIARILGRPRQEIELALASGRTRVSTQA